MGDDPEAIILNVIKWTDVFVNIKIEITKEELEKYIQYERIRRENPCYIKCAGPGGCCGCQEQSDWCKKLRELGELEKIGAIEKYAEAVVDYEEVLKEYENIKNKLNLAKVRVDNLQNGITIMEE